MRILIATIGLVALVGVGIFVAKTYVIKKADIPVQTNPSQVATSVYTLPVRPEPYTLKLSVEDLRKCLIDKDYDPIIAQKAAMSAVEKVNVGNLSIVVDGKEWRLEDFSKRQLKVILDEEGFKSNLTNSFTPADVTDTPLINLISLMKPGLLVRPFNPSQGPTLQMVCLKKLI